MQKLSVIVINIVLFSTLFFSCAQTGNISGGDKDTVAPVALRINPLNQSTQFANDEIEIVFDEFFELKDMDKKFLTSPPMKHKPKITIAGKKLKIQILDTLTENTTYNLDFKNAIVDFNEANPIPAFSYVFSTGDVIDTLKVGGTIVDAWTYKPIENMSILLYAKNFDSIPFKEIPSFLTRSDAKGNFSVTNIRPGKYKIFALLDGNENLKYDQPTETIAFLTDLMVPKAERMTRTDTLKVKKLKYNSQTARFDTVMVDSIAIKRFTYFWPDSIKMKSFKENNSNQYIVKSSRPDRGRISIIMNQPIDKKFRIDLISPSQASKKWFTSEINPIADTLTYWISDTTISTLDTLLAAITYPHRDSMGIIKYYADTLEFTYIVPIGIDKNKIPNKISLLKTNLRSNAIDRNTPLRLTFKTPIIEKNLSKIVLYEMDDSIYSKVLTYKLAPHCFINRTTDGLREAYRTNAKTMLFIFGKPLSEIPTISYAKNPSPWYNATFNATQDTLTVDITDPAMHKLDTIPLKVGYTTKGVLGIENTLQDTLKLAVKKSLYTLYGKKTEFTFTQDTTQLRTWNVAFTTDPDGKSFNLEVAPDALKDLFGNTNDTLVTRFIVSPLNAYGSIIANLSNLPQNSVLEVLDDKANLVRSIELKNKVGNLKYTIELLKPANYTLKVWVDKNGNSKWDTGNYLDKKQPEDVYFHKEKIVVKSSWDTITDWNLIK